jgi:hypothetical protein
MAFKKPAMVFKKLVMMTFDSTSMLVDHLSDSLTNGTTLQANLQKCFMYS